MKFLAKLAVSTLFLFSSIAQAQLVYHWDFTSGSATDTVNGVVATLANPAGLSGSGYRFTDVGEGISVDQPGGLAVSSTYTIELVYSLDSNSAGYQNLIDFNDFTTDEAMYAYDDYFYFYDESPDDDTHTFAPGEVVTFQLSRDGTTDEVTARLNGIELWSFEDSSEYAVFAGTNNIMHFFEDDTDEHPQGRVREIRVYSVASLHSVPTLPMGGLAILAAMIALLGFRATRRGTTKPAH